MGQNSQTAEGGFQPSTKIFSAAAVLCTQRLQCSSFLVMAYFPVRDYNMLPEKELHLSLRVESLWGQLRANS